MQGAGTEGAWIGRTSRRTGAGLSRERGRPATESATPQTHATRQTGEPQRTSQVARRTAEKGPTASRMEATLRHSVVDSARGPKSDEAPRDNHRRPWMENWPVASHIATGVFVNSAIAQTSAVCARRGDVGTPTRRQTELRTLRKKRAGSASAPPVGPECPVEEVLADIATQVETPSSVLDYRYEAGHNEDYGEHGTDECHTAMDGDVSSREKRRLQKKQ